MISFEVLGNQLLAAVLAYAIGFLGTGIMPIVGLAYAVRRGVRVWIDEYPDLEYARTSWPPLRSTSNMGALFAMSPIITGFVVVLVLTPDKWL